VHPSGRAIELRVLGPLALRGSDGEELSAVLSQPRRVALLAYLALATPGEFQRRAKLLGIFWPEHDEAHARGALRQALWFLRQALGADALPGRGDGEVRLDPAACWCDATAFEAAVAARDPDAAVALYRGELLEGVYLNGAPAFDEWLEWRRGLLARAYAAAVEEIASRHAAQENYAAAAECWRTLAARTPESGRVVLALMRTLEAGGERVVALHEAERHRALLAREFGTTPDAAVLAFAERLRRHG